MKCCVELIGKTTGNAQQLGESGWLTVRTSSTGKVTIVGRMFGAVVSTSAECEIGELTEGALTTVYVPFTVPANARLGFLGYVGNIRLTFDDGTLIDMSLD